MQPASQPAPADLSLWPQSPEQVNRAEALLVGAGVCRVASTHTWLKHTSHVAVVTAVQDSTTVHLTSTGLMKLNCSPWDSLSQPSHEKSTQANSSYLKGREQ